MRECTSVVSREGAVHNPALISVERCSCRAPQIVYPVCDARHLIGSSALSLSTVPIRMIPQFALRLIVGLSLTWCLLPRRLITSGFFRIQLLVTLGLSVLVFLTAGQWEELETQGLTILQVGMVAAALGSFVGSVLWTLERRRGGAIVCYLVAGLSALTLAWLQVAAAGERVPGWLAVLDGLSGAWVLGGLTGAMLLGHWYLTATGMSLTPLQHGVRLAQAAVALRLIVAVAGVMTASEGVQEAVVHQQFIWTLLRWLAGLAGPLVLVLMTPGTLKYRNTQSATGVLFAAVILAFIGEAAALLLRRELGWVL